MSILIFFVGSTASEGIAYLSPAQGVRFGVKSGSAALFAEFVFFLVLAPDRGNVGGATFFGAPVAVVERPEFPAVVVDALPAAKGGAVPGRVVIETVKVGAVTANGKHFLSEYEYSANKIHSGEARVLAPLPKVLAVTQRSPRLGAPPRCSVRRGAFSPAVESA